MQKTLVLLFFAAFAAALPAQNERLEFGVEASAGFSNVRFRADADPFGLYEAVREHLAPRFTSGLHAFARYRLSRRFSAQVGAGYWISGFRQKRFAVNGVPPAPFYPVAAVIGIESKTTYADLAFPLDFRYFIFSGKSRWYLSAGFLSLVKINHKKADTAYYDDGGQQTLTYKDGSTRAFNLSGRLGAGVEIPLGKGPRLYLQPTAGHALLDANESEGFWLWPYAFSFHVGLVF